MGRLRRSHTANYFIAGVIALGAAFCVPNASFGSPLSSKASSSSKKRDAIKKLLKRNSLSALPSASSAVFSKTSAAISSLDYSGEPPMLSSIPQTNIAELFWRPGVIDALAAGTPSQLQCGEFFAGPNDGESGGMGACAMAEGVGYTFADLIESQTSLCYMQSIQSKQAYASQAVSLVSGRLPTGGITKLFSTPSAKARTIKARIVGEDTNPSEGSGAGGLIYLRIASAKDNTANRNLYEATTWHCNNGDTHAHELNYVRVTSQGGIVISNSGYPERGGMYSSSVSGGLKKSSSALAWDPSVTRQIDKHFVEDGNSFNANVEVGANIITKSLDKFDGDARRSYSVSTFSGSDVSNVRFLSGAYRGSSNDSQGHQFDFVGATEFRDSYYAAAPQNSLLDQVEDFDFADDKFFDTEQELRLDLSAYPCDATADVEVQVEMRSEFMQEVRKNCEPSDFRNMHFCHESIEIRSAEMNFGPYCVDNGPGPS